jgi:hypothetical protein
MQLEQSLVFDDVPAEKVAIYMSAAQRRIENQNNLLTGE